MPEPPPFRQPQNETCARNPIGRQPNATDCAADLARSRTTSAIGYRDFANAKTQLNGPGRPLPAKEMGRYRRARRELLADLEGTSLSAAQAAVAPEPEQATEVFHDEGTVEL